MSASVLRISSLLLPWKTLQAYSHKSDWCWKKMLWKRYLNIICLQSLNQDIEGIFKSFKNMGNHHYYLFKADAVHQLHYFLFFPHLSLLNMYHFVRNNPQCGGFKCWPGRTSSVVIKHWQKSDCWPSVLHELCCVDAFSCFWALSFYVEGTENCYMNVTFYVDCGIWWLYTGFYSVCKLHQNKTNTKRTVHRMYTSYCVKSKLGSASCVHQLWSDCQQITFFFPAFFCKF